MKCIIAIAFSFCPVPKCKPLSERINPVERKGTFSLIWCMVEVSQYKHDRGRKWKSPMIIAGEVFLSLCDGHIVLCSSGPAHKMPTDVRPRGKLHQGGEAACEAPVLPVLHTISPQMLLESW